MSDERVRAITRDAERTDDGPTWARAALELARVGDFDAAGRAAWLALITGGDPSDALDALAPAAAGLRGSAIHIVDLATRAVRRFEVGMHWQTAWSPSGRTLAVPTKHGQLVLITATR